MAVRRFNGGTDVVTVEPLVPNFVGAGTLAVVWRVDANANNGVWCGDAAGFQRWGFITVNDTDTYYTVGGFVDGVNYAPDTWYLSVFTKPAGSPATVRAHQVDLATGIWTHQDRGTVNDQSASQTAIHFGVEISTGFRLNGEIAAAALWVGTELSDAECETLDGVGAMLALAPDGLWAFNQASTSDPVLDLSGNGYDQTAITGTTVLTGDDPPNFDLSTGPNEGAVDFTASLALATTAARDSQGVAGWSVSLGLVTGASRPSEGAAGYTVGLSLATAGARVSQGVAGYLAHLALATVGADPDNAPVVAPVLSALGLHALALAAVGAHDPTLSATGSHPT